MGIFVFKRQHSRAELSRPWYVQRCTLYSNWQWLYSGANYDFTMVLILGLWYLLNHILKSYKYWLHPELIKFWLVLKFCVFIPNYTQVCWTILSFIIFRNLYSQRSISLSINKAGKCRKQKIYIFFYSFCISLLGTLSGWFSYVGKILAT